MHQKLYRKSKRLTIQMFFVISSLFLGTSASGFFESLSEFNARNRAALAESIRSIWGSKSAEAGSRAELKPAQKALTFDDLPGMPIEVREIVDFFKDSARFRRLGARAPKGVLLYGPPGTGKTSVARVIATQTGAEFFHASASEFVEIYVGVGPKRIRELFEKAKACSKAIVFIDEIDAIGSRKARALRGCSDEYNQTLNQLLTEMDGYDESSNILVIAATNRPEDLDEALLRPGRFDRLIKIDLPNKEVRFAILKRYLATVAFDGDDAAVWEVAQHTEGLSGAHLENLVNEAAIIAAREGASSVSSAHLLQTLQR